jgi:hypothetical protein
MQQAQVDRLHILAQLAAVDAVDPGAGDVADACQVDTAGDVQSP